MCYLRNLFISATSLSYLWEIDDPFGTFKILIAILSISKGSSSAPKSRLIQNIRPIWPDNVLLLLSNSIVTFDLFAENSFDLVALFILLAFRTVLSVRTLCSHNFSGNFFTPFPVCPIFINLSYGLWIVIKISQELDYHLAAIYSLLGVLQLLLLQQPLTRKNYFMNE